MNATNKVLSIIAFYLSEYDMEAVTALGFRNRSEAINTISESLGSGNNYLKLRRDEFDALPDSASSRMGWRNRPPLKEVSEMAAYLHQFSFDELTEIVKSLLGKSEEDAHINTVPPSLVNSENIDEEELEHIVNFTDPSASIIIKTTTGTQRVYNRSIVAQLKKLYRGCCQICGVNPAAEFGLNICEAHHIDFFSESQNNDASNIIILCPNHHRLIHMLKLSFNSERLTFYAEGKEMLHVKLDYHLKRNS